VNIGLWLIVTGIGFYPYAAHRTDYIHLLPLLFLSLLLAALCLGSSLGEKPAKRSWARIFCLAAGMTVALPAFAALRPAPLDDWSKTPSPTSRRVEELPGPRGAGIYGPFRFSRQYRDIIHYLNSAVLPGERIFSGTWRHDVFMINDIMLYFIAERDPGTYYWCVDAGVTTTPEVQRQMIAELGANHVNWIVLWTAARPDTNSPMYRSPGARM